MNTKVDMTFSVDIEDVYLSMNYKDQQEFIKERLGDLGGWEDIIELCMTEDDIAEFVEANIEKLSDEALLNEIKKRGLEV